ncbi:hypothetical protein FACHB389_35905 [Nostoc calcicola FACHB-389]|nr:hypothetical protein [Nostoc calcicola FACHB-3891]OKH14606.1 hypothetical protein FACHB389_35905 [Nostoc calcicola FACHB-389]
MTQIKDISVVKTLAGDNDWLVLQSSTGITYRILKSNLIPINAGNNNIDLSGLSEIFELTDTDFLIAQTSTGTFKINKNSIGLTTYLKWLLTETSGTTAIDSSINNRNGIFSNVSLSANGAILNGSNSLIYANTNLSQLSPLAVRIDIKTTTTQSAGIWEFRNTQDVSGGTYAPGLRMNAGKIYAYGYPNSSANSSLSYNDNSWHRILAVFDQNRIRLFADKIKIIDISGAALPVFTGYFSIGYGKTLGYFNGQVKNFQVWNSTLTDAQGISLS